MVTAEVIKLNADWAKIEFQLLISIKNISLIKVD